MNQKAVKLNIIKENKAKQDQLLQEFVQRLYGFGAATQVMKKMAPVARAFDGLVSAGTKITKLPAAAKKLAQATEDLMKVRNNGLSRFTQLLDAIQKNAPEAGAAATVQGTQALRTSLQQLANVAEGIRKTIAKIKQLQANSNLANQPALQASLRSALGKCEDALQAVENAGIAIIAKTKGITTEAARVFVKQTAAKVDEVFDLVPTQPGKALEETDVIIDALPPPREVLVLPAPNKRRVLELGEEIIDNERKALPAPQGPVRDDYIPEEIFTDPMKSAGLKKYVKYAVAAGLAGGILALIANSDPTGAIAQIIPGGGSGGSGGSGGRSGGRQSPLGFTYNCPKFNRFAVAVTSQRDIRLATAMIQAYLITNGESPLKGGPAPDEQAKKLAADFLKKPTITPAAVSIGIDGKCGDNTQDAVGRFQQKNKLTKDGIVGPNTWAVLTGKAGSSGKEKAQDAKKPEQVLTKNEKQGAEVTINQLLTRMRKAKKIQNIINAYIRFRERLILAVRKIAGSGDMSMVDPSSRAGLDKIVSETFPEIPGNLEPAQRYVFASNKFRELPDKIMVGQSIFANIDEVLTPEAILKLAIKILLDEEQEEYGGTIGYKPKPAGTKLNTRNNKFNVRDPQPRDGGVMQNPILPKSAPGQTKLAPDGSPLEESKSYDIDFSKWKPMIKNSY